MQIQMSKVLFGVVSTRSLRIIFGLRHSIYWFWKLHDFCWKRRNNTTQETRTAKTPLFTRELRWFITGGHTHIFGQLSQYQSEIHYDDVIMTMLASQITSLTVVYSIVHSGVNQRKHQSSASLAFVREIHRGPVNFPHKWPVTRKMFPFDDVIMNCNDHIALREVECWCQHRYTV